MTKMIRIGAVLSMLALAACTVEEDDAPQEELTVEEGDEAIGAQLRPEIGPYGSCYVSAGNLVYVGVHIDYGDGSDVCYTSLGKSHCSDVDTECWL